MSGKRIVRLHKKKAAAQSTRSGSTNTQGAALNTMKRTDGLHLLSAIDGIAATQWDALLDATACPAPPCLRHAFLATLEETGCVGGRSGWLPKHAGLWRDGELVAAMPLYEKHHSYGEYVFDWAWAEAYHRHGLAYYPKWLAAVPFTPVPGPRILGRDPGARKALIEAVIAQAREARHSSFHLLFPAADELPLLAAAGMSIREGVQFHWENAVPALPQCGSAAAASPATEPERNGARWNGFDAFLASLNHAKRKKIRQERRRAADHGLRMRWLDGHDAGPRDWDFLYRCYAATYAAHRSSPYLTPTFFHRLAERMPDSVRLLLALRDDSPVAAAYFLRDDDALYGRYWGTTEPLAFLHFELCYYQAIEYCIAEGLARFEGGAQGEHKLSRGLLPIRTYSAHWIADHRFRRAVDDFVARERQGVDFYLDELSERLPFRREQAQGPANQRPSTA